MAARAPARLTRAEGRRFGLVVGAAFATLGALAWWRGHGTAATVLGALAAALLAGGLLVPGQLDPVHRGWMALARAISRVTAPILMGLVYFLVITPTGLLLRLFGHRLLTERRGAGTAWVVRSAERDPHGDMTRQF